MTFRRYMPTRSDVVLAVALAALYLGEVFGESGFEGHRLVSTPLALVMAASVAWRRTLPVVSVACGLVIIEYSNLAGPQALAETAAFLFAIIVAIYSAGAYADGLQLSVSGLMVLAAIPLAGIEPGQPTSASDIGFMVVIFGGPFVVGRVMRRRRARERTLESRAVELEQEGQQRAQEAVAEERARIARELHDVIAHAVSVVVLQARGARRVLPEDQAPVREALNTIEQSAGEALKEMRRLLSLLREQEEALALAPQPSLRRVDALVESVRGAGLPVELSVEGDIDNLPPGVDVSAYRIVQEALTNTLKHAGAAHARVVIRRNGADLQIEVTDDGRGNGNGEGSGHGLVGMRERVAVYGGRLEAGREPGGGYALRAQLPLGSVS
jgi:signal transduction histidine kinase